MEKTNQLISNPMKRRSFLPAPKVYRPSSPECEQIISDVPKWNNRIGCRVCISGAKYGILRYFGYTKFADGFWCGIELLEPVGKNNGSVEGVRYFFCNENYGIFAPVFKVELADDCEQADSYFKSIPNPRFEYSDRTFAHEHEQKQSKLAVPKTKSLYSTLMNQSQVSHDHMTQNYVSNDPRLEYSDRTFAHEHDQKQSKLAHPKSLSHMKQSYVPNIVSQDHMMEQTSSYQKHFSRLPKVSKEQNSLFSQGNSEKNVLNRTFKIEKNSQLSDNNSRSSPVFDFSPKSENTTNNVTFELGKRSQIPTFHSRQQKLESEDCRHRSIPDLLPPNAYLTKSRSLQSEESLEQASHRLNSQEGLISEDELYKNENNWNIESTFDEEYNREIPNLINDFKTNSLLHSFNEENAVTIDKNINEAREKGITIDRNVKEASEKGITIDKKINEARENDITINKNMKEAREIDLTLDKHIKEARGKDIIIDKNIKEAREKDLTIDKSIKEASEKYATFDQSLKEATAKDLTIDKNINEGKEKAIITDININKAEKNWEEIIQDSKSNESLQEITGSSIQTKQKDLDSHIQCEYNNLIDSGDQESYKATIETHKETILKDVIEINQSDDKEGNTFKNIIATHNENILMEIIDNDQLEFEGFEAVLASAVNAEIERPLSILTESSGDTGFQDTQISHSPVISRFPPESDSDIGSAEIDEIPKSRSARIIDGKLYYAEVSLEEATIVSEFPEEFKKYDNKTFKENDDIQPIVDDQSKQTYNIDSQTNKIELKGSGDKKVKEANNKKQSKNRKCEINHEPKRIRKPSPERPWRTPPKMIDKKELEKVEAPKKEKRQMPKKNVVSKIKAMIEATSCKTGNKEDENEKEMKKPRPVKTSRWDSVTSKIEASLAKEKQKVKKIEIKSKINTNLTKAITKQELLDQNIKEQMIENSLKIMTYEASDLHSSLEYLQRIGPRESCDSNTSEISHRSRGKKRNDQLVETRSCKDKSPGSQGSSTRSNRSSMKEGKTVTEFMEIADTKQGSRSLVNKANVKTLVQQNNKRNVLLNSKPTAKIESSRTSIRNSLISNSKSVNVRTKSSEISSANRNAILSKTSSVASRPDDKKPLKQDQNRSRCLRPTTGLVKSGHSKPDLLATSVASNNAAKEICRLEALCESRTKELNYMRMQMKGTNSGFDAMAVLLRYLTEELDAFSVPRLLEDLKKLKEDLKNKNKELNESQSLNAIINANLSCIHAKHKDELNQIETDQKEELMSLKDGLTQFHQEELQKFEAEWEVDKQNLRSEQKKELANLKDIQQKALREIRETNQMLLEDIKKQSDHQLKELKREHKLQMQDLVLKHEEERKLILQQVEELSEQRQALEERAKTLEDAIQRDADVKVQVALARCRDLQSEVDSLKMVLDMRKKELDEVRKQNRELQKELEELPVAKERIKKLEAKIEDLKAMVDIKVKIERQLSREHTFLQESYKTESKVNKRLSMQNEELQWRLRYNRKSLTPELTRRRSWTEDSYDSEELAFIIPFQSVSDCKPSELSKFQSLPRRRKCSEPPGKNETTSKMKTTVQTDIFSKPKKDRKPLDPLAYSKSPEQKNKVSSVASKIKSKSIPKSRTRTISEPSVASNSSKLVNDEILLIIDDSEESQNFKLDHSSIDDKVPCERRSQVTEQQTESLAEESNICLERIVTEDSQPQSLDSSFSDSVSLDNKQNVTLSDSVNASETPTSPSESSLFHSRYLEQSVIEVLEPKTGELGREEQLRAIGLIQLTDSFSEDRSDTCSNDQQLSWDYAPLSDSYQSNDSQSLDQGLDFDLGECSSRGANTPVRECLSFHNEVVQQAMHLVPQPDSENDEEADQKLNVDYLERINDHNECFEFHPTMEYEEVCHECLQIDISNAAEKKSLDVCKSDELESMTDSGVAFQEMTDSGVSFHKKECHMTDSGVSFHKKECHMTDSGVALEVAEDFLEQVKQPLQVQLSTEFNEDPAPADTYL